VVACARWLTKAAETQRMRSTNGARRAGARVIGVLLLAGSPAAAEPAVGAGVCTYSCNEFTRASAGDEARELLYFSWAQGWMTARDLDQALAIARAVRR
jgi:hypothetical protein